MKRLLYFSDCPIFGGSEMILVHLGRDRAIRSRFEIHFAYRAHKEYRDAAVKYFPKEVTRHPLFLLSNSTLFYRMNLVRGEGAVARWFMRLLKLPLFLVSRSGIYDAYNFLALYRLFHRVRPDILHINNGGYPGAESCRIAVFSAKAAGIQRIVFTVNNLAFQQKGPLDRAMDRYIARRVDVFTVASKQAWNELSQKRGIPIEKIRQIFSAIEERNVVMPREVVCDRFQIPKDKKILMQVGLLTKRKGQIHLLEAFRRIRELKPDVYRQLVLVLVGNGEDEASLKSYVRQHELTETVIFTGYQAEYDSFINASDLFILPSIANEDMPLVILEAMYLGKPIIASRLAGISEQIEDGVSGVLISPDKMEGLAEAVLQMLENPEAMVQYGRNARRRYEEIFSTASTTRKFLELYGTVLQE
jgi:glycosyltransferase involved in cell wall biosynthesis